MTRVAVVGLGPMGRRHVEAVVASPELELVGVVDRSEEALQAFRRAFPDLSTVAMVGEVDELEKPDLVCVATNGPSHVVVAEAAIESGAKFLLVEKPLATSLADANQLISRCKENCVALAVNHSRRWSTFYDQLADHLHGPELGGPAVAWCAFGGTGLGNIATHWFDLYHQLFRAAPVAVSAKLDHGNLPNPRGKQYFDPGGYVVVEFANGARLHVEQPETSGTVTPQMILCRYGRVIIDEQGRTCQASARVADMRNESLTRYGIPLEPLSLEIAPALNLVELASNAMRQLVFEGKARCSGHDGYQALEILVAAYQSSEEEGRRIQLPISDQNIKNRCLTIT